MLRDIYHIYANHLQGSTAVDDNNHTLPVYPICKLDDHNEILYLTAVAIHAEAEKVLFYIQS